MSSIGSWEDRYGCPTPLGASWIPATESYNFAIHSRFAEQVTLLFYASEDLVTPAFCYEFHPLRNKTGRVWHARIGKSRIRTARYYAYSIAGPRPAANRFE